MVHSPVFFDAADSPAPHFTTRENCLKAASKYPDALIAFLKKAFESGEMTKGHHPILGSLFDFYLKLQEITYEDMLLDPASIKVLEALQKMLYLHYETFAKTYPVECLAHFKQEIASHNLSHARHRVLGDITALKDSLPKDNPVYQFLHPRCERERYLKLAKDEPLLVIEFLKEAFLNGDINEGKHPLLGKVLEFMQETILYCSSKEISSSLKPQLSEHYQRLAFDKPEIFIKHIKAEDALRYFRHGKHVIFGDIKTFCDSLEDEQRLRVKNLSNDNQIHDAGAPPGTLLQELKIHAITVRLKNLLKGIERHERLVKEALYKPRQFIEGLKLAFDAGNIIDGYYHEAYGDLNALACKIYEDAPEAVEGKQQVLAYLESKGIWTYPLPTRNPITGQDITPQDMARKLAVINAFWERHKAPETKVAEDVVKKQVIQTSI